MKGARTPEGGCPTFFGHILSGDLPEERGFRLFGLGEIPPLGKQSAVSSQQSVDDSW